MIVMPEPRASIKWHVMDLEKILESLTDKISFIRASVMQEVKEWSM